MEWATLSPHFTGLHKLVSFDQSEGLSFETIFFYLTQSKCGVDDNCECRPGVHNMFKVMQGQFQIK